MTILGIETSCDETSAAIVRDGRLLANVTATQLFHSQYGGVVPELASRAHQRRIIPVVEEALAKAGVSKNELDGIAAVYGPGLVGAILVGLSFGKSMALGLGIPFVGVDHMEAHIFSNLIDDPKPEFPFVNLTVSGGHTQLVLVKGPFEHQVLGETKDDAAGEAFDKVAKMLGIGYPGGPLIDKYAKDGDPAFVSFPRPYLEEGSLEFSFSGLKTSVLYYLRKSGFIPFSDGAEASITQKKLRSDLCASFQAAVVDVLVNKAIRAAQASRVKSITVSGGVSANSELRTRMVETAVRHGLSVFMPKFEYCTDNGAMVAMVGYTKMQSGKTSSLELTAEPNLSLA
ncbi:MAG: tRNA (adenosine(37)-N6)-threonylcarbamoyltransferase complex transferase subunit TsaD [Ignavibacteriales bacterium]|nr:tRNA (adenosine(37)-N6)-threonylcarbamoyltransferase complex transferase subunit TsaD [Ignavibacteriales bacterium]